MDIVYFEVSKTPTPHYTKVSPLATQVAVIEAVVAVVIVVVVAACA